MMAARLINRIVCFNEFVYGIRKSCRLHTSVKFDKNIQFTLSDIGEGIREVTLKSWYVDVNDKVAQFDNICEVESDKATVTITSRYDGIIKKLYYKTDEIAYVGKPLVDIDVPEDDSSVKDTRVKEEKVLSDEVISETHSEINVVQQTFNEGQNAETFWDKSLATPAVRRIAAEHKIKINEVRATGKNNRVLKEDILKHIDDKNKISETSSIKCVVKPLNRITKIMMKTMTDSNSIPTFGYSDEFDFSRLFEIKSRLAQSMDVKINYLPFILKAISRSLDKHPILNASIDKDFKSMIYKSHHNIGVAIASPSGLIVPNLKNVENLTIMEIYNEIKRLQKAAFDNSLKPSELADGTFSVSNIGAVGGIQGIPCILPPEVAIVAVGKVRKLPRYNEKNEVVPAHIVNFTFCADHRVVDGATVSRFSSMIKDYLENPELLLIEM